MAIISFRPIALADCKAVQQKVYTAECRNCDLNFMNLMSWRFLFETEIAFHREWMLLRFKSAGHLAYLPPVGEGDWNDILQEMMEDAHAHGESFRLMGVCKCSLDRLNETMPNTFVAAKNRSYTDYIYKRETMAALAGKKLQAKRNHINKFIKLYPDYEFLPLSESFFQKCLELVAKWHALKENRDSSGYLSPKEELNALQFVFTNWEALGGLGGVLRVGEKIVAFTYGAPINYDTFDICVEKADVDYEGAFAMINREFARSLPDQYVYLNREEDLGIEGLRTAKMSYHPDYLLHKYIVMTKSEAELEELDLETIEEI